MRTFNPKKNIHIEIQANDLSNTNGHTVWHVIGGERKRAISRNADGKDFDWMTDKQLKDFERGVYKFSVTAQDVSDYFNYIY